VPDLLVGDLRAFFRHHRGTPVTSAAPL
jgi:hypothetical protein